MHALPPALAAMGAYRQFICYVPVPSKTRPGKTDKFPVAFTSGKIVNAHDKQHWTTADIAIAAAAGFGGDYGVGFVFTESDPFWFLDIDECVTPDGHDWTPIAKSFVAHLPGAAVEVSRSGRGLHIFGSGRPPEHGCKNSEWDLEFYHAGRFVALTGIGATGDISTDFTAVLPALTAQFFPPVALNLAYRDDMPVGSLLDVWAAMCLRGPAPEWRGPTDDADLLRRALQSRGVSAAFSGKATFADLWQANLDALGRSYPDPARAYDASKADAALAQHLAFWTGKDCARIERLMRSPDCALMREKWDRADYMPRTILGAVVRQFEVLTDKAPEPLAGAPDGPLPSATDAPPRPTPVSGSTYSGCTEQETLFAGCVYIRHHHRVLVPGGQMLKPEQFKVHFGGYTYALDHANERTTRDAWEAFTQNQGYRAPRVDLPCFRPDLPPSTIVKVGGQDYANMYWPVDIPRKVGDPGRFLTHLSKVLPDERDQQILLCYMAACVQHKGVKFQWAPLLQGVEGNGKTLFTRCVANAIGKRYVHWPKASQLTNHFNAWLIGKIFYAVEDIYIPGDRAELWEIIKPMITGGDGLEIEQKGIDQISFDIVGNFIFNSNHQNALPKSENDRRLANLFCAQQQASDLIRDGMAGDYFPNLYTWLRAEGYAIVSELLHTYPIPDELNPATLCQLAPVTTSTRAAIAASAGGIEQELQEAIEQGLPGFSGGWISSIMLDRLLERLQAHRRVTHSKRKEMLESMGYVYHPSLLDGRVNNLVMPDNGKPRLFIRRGSPAITIATAAEVATAYQLANNHGRTPFPVGA